MKLPKKKLFFSLSLLIFLFLAVPSEAFAFGPAIIGVLLGSKLVWGAVITLVGTGLLAKFGPGVAGDIGAGFLNALIGVIYWIPLNIAATLYLLATMLLIWVIDPDFLAIGITRPENEVAYNAWRLIRDFANMGFILALVAIGLGTALRYGEYQLQKALPLFIIIALLINFTPVIMGILIDAANLVIRFFVEEAVGKNLWELTKGVYEASFKPFTQITDDPTETLAAATAQLIFNLLGTLIMLLFFLLFFFRFVALMILFILSPLAFFAYILPITRPFWNLWWRQFISWLLVGVFGAFFLMLAAQMTHFMWDATIPSGAFEEGPFQWFADFFAVFLVAALPIAILYLGLFITLSTIAMGTQRVISAGKAAGAWAGTKALARGKTYAKEKWQKSPMAERISMRLSQAQAPEEVKIAGRKIPVVSQVAKWGAGASAAAERAIGRAGLAAREIGITDVGREAEEAKKRSAEMNYSYILSPEKTKTQRAGTIIGAMEAGQFKKLEKLGLREDEIEKLLRESLEIHPEAFKKAAIGFPKKEVLERVLAGFPEERRLAAGDVTDEEKIEKGYRNIVDKIIAEAKPEEIAKMAPSALKDADVKEAIHEFWGGPQIAAAARAFGRDFVDAFNEEMKRKGSKWYWDEKTKTGHNPKVLKYVGRTTAQELGFRLPPEEGTVPGPPPPPPGGPPPPPPPGAPPPRRPGGRPGVGGKPPEEKPSGPPGGRPGVGVEPGIEEELRKIVEERRRAGEEELRRRWRRPETPPEIPPPGEIPRGPRGRPGIGV